MGEVVASSRHLVMLITDAVTGGIRMNQDEQHLNLLAIFHYVLGAMTILGASLILIYVAMGMAMVSGAFGAGKDAPPREVGLLFIALGSAGVLFGWTLGILIAVAGRKLHRRTSRTFCVVIAVIEAVMLMPLGTALGVFTMIVLMRESVVKLFETSAPPTAPSPTVY